MTPAEHDAIIAGYLNDHQGASTTEIIKGVEAFLDSRSAVEAALKRLQRDHRVQRKIDESSGRIKVKYFLRKENESELLQGLEAYTTELMKAQAEAERYIIKNLSADPAYVIRQLCNALMPSMLDILEVGLKFPETNPGMLNLYLLHVYSKFSFLIKELQKTDNAKEVVISIKQEWENAIKKARAVSDSL